MSDDALGALVGFVIGWVVFKLGVSHGHNGMLRTKLTTIITKAKRRELERAARKEDT
jgi:hypothetical protein